MAIKRFYSKKKKPGWKLDRAKGLYWSWGFAIWLNGRGSKYIRDHGFQSATDAEAAVAQLRFAQKDQKYGFLPRAAVPTLERLIDRHLATTSNKREHTRAKRVLLGLLAEVPAGIKATDVTTAYLELYVEKRFKDGLKAASIDRELNIISACLNAISVYYDQLRQWRAPRIPRPEYSKKPRKRVIQAEEKESLLAYFNAPQRTDETPRAAVARYRAGRRVYFALLTGCRHSEMLRIKKIHVDWRQRSCKVQGTKTDSDRTISPLPDTAFSILEEMAALSKTEYVFGSPHPTTRFYTILKEACQACGIPYGRKVADGIVLHDARHTATTVLLQEGCDPATVQEQMGWSQREYLLHYSHSTAGSRQRAAEAMERVMNEPPEVLEVKGSH